MLLQEAIRRVRMEIGDPARNFETQSIGDGMTSDYDLPKQNIDTTTFQVSIINGAVTTPLVAGNDYTLNAEQGFLMLSNPVAYGAVLATSGTAWGLFTDDDLTDYINDSVLQHVLGRTRKQRVHTNRGFISYIEEPITLDNLPEIEEPLIVMLSTINILWVLANDAATDTDIATAEGTVVNRIGRYSQLMAHIQELTMRYQDYCGQLNVGLYRNTTTKLRRRSYTTGRYVPVFEDREYDDARWPVRELPQIDNDDLDESGIPSPLWNAQGF